LSFDGAKKLSPELGRFELAAYYTNIDDFIGETTTSDTTGVDPVHHKTKNNLGSVAVYGAEAAWRSPAEKPLAKLPDASRTWTDSPDALALSDWQFATGWGRSLAFVPLSRLHPRFLVG
jgi:outer membrane receptor protein involved in Fe transport